VAALLLRRIVKLVRAIRKGWIKTGKAKRAEQQQPQVYLLWGDDDQVNAICPAVQSLPGSTEFYQTMKIQCSELSQQQYGRCTC
jgi:hypothetical protein